MKILIREGSAAKNFDALIGLLNDYPDQMMFCSDDLHPDSLIKGHIDLLCARAVAKGIDPFKVLRAACLNPVLHYRLDTGLLRIGDPADLILVKDLRTFRVLRTYIRGELVAENGVSKVVSAPAASPINQFNCLPKVPADFATPLADFATPMANFATPLADSDQPAGVFVIEALDGQLITNKLTVPATDLRPENGFLQANPGKDILKIVVVNRYHPAPVAKAFIRNFGLKKGALASSVAHDSHNIVAVGVDDDSICRAVNLVIEQKGGLSCVDPSPSPAQETSAGLPEKASSAEAILPLPVAGLMSMDDGYRVADAYTAIDAMAKRLGSTLSSPYMTLSFMALLVIPHLKLSDRGLFDGDKFELINSSSSS